MKPIKNILNLSLGEFLCKLYGSKNKELYYSQLDINRFIKKISNDYDPELIYLLKQDLLKYCEDLVICEYNGDIYELGDLPDFEYKDIASKLEEFPKKHGLIDICNINDKIVQYDGSNISRYLTELLDYSNYDNHLKLFNFSGLWRLSLFATEVEKLFDEKIDQEVKENLRATYQEMNKKRLVGNDRTITFIDLFKKEYAESDKIERFKNWLYNKNFVSKESIPINDATNLSRIYFLLKSMGITNPNQPMKKAITSFFKEFGVEVVEKIDKNATSQQTTRRTVTSNDARTTDYINSPDGTGNILSEATKSFNEIFKND